MIADRPGTVAQALERGMAILSQAGLSNAEGETRELVARALGETRRHLWARLRDPWPAEAEASLSVSLEYRRRGRPLAHLLGEWDFLDMTVAVSPDVLVPRPETEELFAWIAQFRSARPPRHVLDVGTGSGVLALAVSRQWPQARVVAVDLSEKALAVARANADRCQRGGHVQFILSDLTEGLTPGFTFDVIVANLPYVTSAEMIALAPEVRHEPALALDGGVDGLECIRRLILQAGGRLTPGGDLFLEVGWTQAETVAAMLKEHDFSTVEIRRDFAGAGRFVRGGR